MKSEIAKYYCKPKPFWENIPKTLYEEFKANTTIINVAKNEIIYSEGHYPKGLYILKKGIARMFIINAAGEEQTIYMMTNNEMFGYRAIVCNDDSPVFISAIEPCEIEMINKDIFLARLHQSFELTDLFLNYFGNEFRVLCNKISFFSLKPVSERVALSLLILNQKFGKEHEGNAVQFSKKEIANYAGTIIETLSRQLKILSEMNAIEIRGRKILLTDMDLLYKRANI